MAAPESVTLRNLTGTFNLNKQKSDSTDALLAMQGVSWLVRQAVKYSNITLHIKEYVDEAGVTNIDIEQVSTGNMRNLEQRLVDWEYREADDKIFGKLKGRSRFLKLEDVEDQYLKQGWDEGSLMDGEVFQTYVESLGKKPNWTADQIWGFEIIDGQRKHVRHVVAKKGKEEHKVKLVYDWVA